jgi:hypothetical protein
MSGFATKRSPIADHIWGPRKPAPSETREFGHKHVRAIAIGAVIGIALGFAATAESGNAVDEVREDSSILVLIERPSAPLEAPIVGEVDTARDAAHIKLLQARGAMSRGALAEAESYLNQADVLDPDSPFVPILRRLIDLSRSRLEMG